MEELNILLRTKQSISSLIFQVLKMFKFVLLMTLADNMLLQNTKIRVFNLKLIICCFKVFDNKHNFFIFQLKHFQKVGKYLPCLEVFFTCLLFDILNKCISKFKSTTNFNIFKCSKHYP